MNYEPLIVSTSQLLIYRLFNCKQRESDTLFSGGCRQRSFLLLILPSKATRRYDVLEVYSLLNHILNPPKGRI